MKVYLVLGDDDYPYGIFSTWNKALSWIRKELYADNPSEWMLQKLKEDRKYTHVYDIESFVIDERDGECH